MKKFLMVLMVLVCLCNFADAQNIQVFCREEAMGEANISKPRIYVQNNGPETLTDFSVRYYIHSEPDKFPVLEDYYTPNSIVALLDPGNGLYAVEYDYCGTSLAPGEIIPNISGNVVGLHNSDWSPWNKDDDPSYQGTSTFIENRTICVFDSDNNVIYGTPPGNPGPGQALEVEFIDFNPSLPAMMQSGVRARNTGSRTISGLVLYYYLYSDVQPVIDIYYAPLAEISVETIGGGHYRIKYDYSDSVIAPGAYLSEAGARIGVNNADWSVMDKSDDYSYQASTVWEINPGITAYDGRGKWLAGNPPEGFDLKTDPGGEVSEPEVGYRDNGPLGVSMTHDFSGARIALSRHDEKNYQLISVPGFGFTDNDHGLPRLPSRSYTLLVPPGATAEGVITSSSSQVYEDFHILPAQARTQKEDDKEFYIDSTFYSKDMLFPASPVEVEVIGQFRGRDLVRVRTYPIQYNPGQNRIILYSELDFDVVFTGGYSDGPGDVSEPVQMFLNNVALNFQFDRYVPNYRGKVLIVTHSNFMTAARLLEEWKLRMGYDVVICSDTNWIYNEIKEIVAAEVPDYLVLLGDLPFIPTLYQGYAGSNFIKFPTDLYYACLDPGDDWIPDMAYGRIPVSVPQQAVDVVQKIIRYEKNPPAHPDFYRNFLAASYFQDNDSIGSDGYADRRFAQTAYEAAVYLESKGYNRNLVFTTDEGVDPRFWNNGIFGVGEEIPDELKKPGFPWDGNTEDIISAFEEGCFLAYHRDHGDINGWTYPQFQNQDAAALTNGELLPVVFSINCLSGSFQASCLSEALLNNPNGGAVGVIGATRVSSSGDNDVLFDGIIDAIWPEYINRFPGVSDAPVLEHPPVTKMGYVMNQGKLRMLEIYGAGSLRETSDIFHYIGDPSMEIRTAEPLDLGLSLPQTNYFVSFWPIALNLSAIPCDEAVATVTMFGERLAHKTITPQDGWIVFNPQYTGTAYVTVTARGYRPFTAELTINHVNGLPPEGPQDPPFPDYQPLSLNIINPEDGKHFYAGMQFQISAAGNDPNNPANNNIGENYLIKLLKEGELIAMAGKRAAIFIVPDPGEYEILCEFTDGYTRVEDQISISVTGIPDQYLYPRLGVLEPFLPLNGIPEVSFNSEILFSFEAFDPNKPGNNEDLTIDITYRNLLTGEMMLIAEEVTSLVFRPSDYFSEYTQDIPSRMTISALNPAHQGSGAAMDFLITDSRYTLSVAGYDGPDAALPGMNISSHGDIFVSTHESTIINDRGATVGIYLSEDYYFDPESDILLGSSIPLPPEMTYIARVFLPDNIIIPGNTIPGDYYLIVVVDNQNHFYEENEEDNIYVKEISIEDPATTMPNLRLSYLYSPSEIQTNFYMQDQITLRYENTGLIPIDPSPGSIVAGLYISEDRILDDDDTLITYSQQEIHDPIEPGSTNELDWDHMFYIPAGFTPGHYYLIAKIDDTEILAESIEVDNVYPIAVEIIP